MEKNYATNLVIEKLLKEVNDLHEQNKRLEGKVSDLLNDIHTIHQKYSDQTDEYLDRYSYLMEHV